MPNPTTPTSRLALRQPEPPFSRLIGIADELRAMAASRERDVFEPNGARCVMMRPAGLQHWADRIEALALQVRDDG